MVGANCIVCVSRVSFDPFHITHPVKSLCQHSTNISKPSFQVSKVAVIVVNLLAWSLLLPVLLSSPIVAQICTTKSSACFLTLADQVCIFGNTTIAISATLLADKILQDLQGWSTIVENRHLFALGDIINLKQAKRFRYTKNVSVLAVMLLGFCLTLYLHQDRSIDSSIWDARKLSLIFSSFIEFHMIVDFCQKFIIIGTVIDALRASLHSTVFNKQVRLVLAMNCNVKPVMNLVIVTLMLWIVMTMIFLIANVYALFDYARFDALGFGVVNFRTGCSVVLSAALYYIHDENLKKKVSRRLYCQG